MSDPADDISRRMQNVRRSVGDDVQHIVETARTLSDWRYHVRHHPWLCVGAAAAIGFLLVPKRKNVGQVDHAETKELIALLKKHNVGVATNAAEGPNGFVKRTVAMAAPFIMKRAMDYAQQRFNGLSGIGAGQSPQNHGSPPTAKGFNIPR